MNPHQNVKHVVLWNPASTATTATNTAHIDSLDFEYVKIVGVLDTAGTNPVTLDVAYGDTTSAFTNISDLVGDTGYTIPAADTSNPQAIVLEIDKRNFPYRYFKVSYTPGAAQVNAFIAELSGAKEAPNTDAERGVSEYVQV